MWVYSKKKGGKWIWIESKSGRTGKWQGNNAVRNNLKSLATAKSQAKLTRTNTKLADIPAPMLHHSRG